jgi:predicted kinase
MRMLVIFSGLPGAGKTTLAEHAARQLTAALLSKDVIEAALWRSEIGSAENSGRAAYEVMTAIAAQQLRMGHSVVLDSVAATESIRATWLTLATNLHVDVRIVECVCSDAATQRTRMEGRDRGIPGWPELSWDEVERVRSRFEPWRTERLVLDAVRPLAETGRAALRLPRQ